MIKKFIYTIFIITAVIVLSFSQVRKSKSSLNRKWMLVEFLSYSKENLMAQNAYMDLTNPKIATAFMGCNTISNTYSILKGNKIKFQIGVMAQMACENMNLEVDFSKEWNNTMKYELKGHKLVLKNDKNIKMVFIAEDWD